MAGRLAVANAAMAFSKICSGLNQNALRFLLPHWMNAVTGVFLRLAFPVATFWLLGLWARRSATLATPRERAAMFALGMICIYGYMLCLLLGLTYTTPISSSLILCTEPVCVFLLSLVFLRQKATRQKTVGILLGVAGALLCICTQHSSDVASDPLLGNCICLLSTLLYSVYLVCSKRFLAHIDSLTFNKWTFLGAGFSAACVTLFSGWHAPVLHEGLFSWPMLVLLFVLIFPSTVSYFLIAIGLKTLSATVAALYGYVILIVSMGVSYAVGQDHFSWMQALSVVLIVASVYYVEIADTRGAAQRNAAAH